MRWRVGPPLCSKCAAECGICLECGMPIFDPRACRCDASVDVDLLERAKGAT
jgi:hypothetical protein